MNANFKPTVIACLRELTDISIQRRLWLGTGAAGMSSFAEAACGLFDDTGLDDLLNKGEPVFGPSIDFQLRLLGETITKADSAFHGMGPDRIIAHPQMDEIRRRAHAILQLLDDYAAEHQ